ncbi:MAG TPA: ABC transporter permease [Flavobacteriaceae bacterium]|nr:ABC transporter permease [Flavobacteriaceae bacterium]
MLYKFIHSVYKEILLQMRDLGGLIILFVMPLVLIITIALIQDNTFRTENESEIPLLLIDNDGGKISQLIQEQISENRIFNIITTINGLPLSEKDMEENVFKGYYQFGIVLPEGLSDNLQLKVNQNVSKVLKSIGWEEESLDTTKNITSVDKKEIKLYFDPATHTSFRTSITNAIDKLISKIETESIYQTFEDEFGIEIDFDQESFLTFQEINPVKNQREIKPNTTQHNVPAWTLFAIFFIVVPLSINIVKEKQQGTSVRLLTLPVPYTVVVAGKTITFLAICMIQFFLMVAVGVYVFPHIGLPALDVSGKLVLMSIIALFSGLAAIGFGILLGTIANTTEQSAPFGATAVVILAAMGGIWIPVFAMPEIMQFFSNISPMNWGIRAFYDVLLRNGNFYSILTEIILLLLFFIITVAIAVFYDKNKRLQ